MQRKLRLTALIGVAALLSACGGDSDSREAAIEKEAKKHGVDADVSVDKNGDVETIAIKSGNTVVGQNLNLPEGFPGDIRLPSDWNMIASAPVPNLSGFSVQALSEDDADTIVSSLRKTMTGDGWTETAADAPTPQMSRINFEKGDRMANFNIIANGDTNAVQLMTMKKP